VSKKPNISKEAQVLLKLLRIALGTEPRKYFGEVVEPFPEGIDWKEVVRLSYEHKVSAIAVDGLEASKYDPYEGLDEKQTEELKAVLVPWIKDVENTEWSYCYYVEVLKTLCQIFKDNGLTPIILKGYGLSLNYPRPSHRGAGDIDVFLVDKDGKPAAEEGDRIAQEVLQLEVVRHGNEHHSSFTFKGILVENHHELRGQFLKTKAEEEYLQTLKRMVMEDTIPAKDIPGAYYPSATFNALFLMRHTIGNLHHGLLNLRQLTDWVIFIRTCGNDVGWEKVNEIQKAAGLSRFAADENRFMERYLGLGIPTSIDATTDEMTINQIAMTIFSPVKVGDTRIERLTYYYRNRWATKYFFGQNWIMAIMRTILVHLRFCTNIQVTEVTR